MNRTSRCLGVLVLSTGGALAAGVGSSVPAGAKTIPHPPCTIVGTSADDTLTGTSHDDVICGLGGNDSLLGRGGNDILLGGAGNDLLVGGPGDDEMRGDAGSDTVSYRDRKTRVVASLFNGLATDATIGDTDHIFFEVENLTGGSGDDTLIGYSAPNVLIGGPGDDHLQGNAGNDTENGGTGDDYLQGGLGFDHLNGDAGDDTLAGDDGNDMLRGGSGRDVELGGGGNDRIEAGDANGTIDGGEGSDTVTCGSGAVTSDTPQHEAADCRGDRHDFQSYKGRVSAFDTAGSTIVVQWSRVDDTAQTWLGVNRVLNPVAIALTPTTRIETEGGAPVRTGDRVEVTAIAAPDLTKLVAVVVQSEP